MSRGNNEAEFESLLETASYLLTSARTSGLDKTEELRTTLKRLRDVVGEADALASSVDMERRNSD